MLAPPSAPVPEHLLGVDFTCAPSRSKPITVAHGQCAQGVLRLIRLDALPTLDAFATMVSAGGLHAPGGWLGAFDFPFGLPRCFVDALHRSPPPTWQMPPNGEGAAATKGWFDAATLITGLRAQCADRQAFATLIDQWGHTWGQGSRPPKLPHRRADQALPGVASTSPLQTRYVPVGKMYFEGLWRLVQAGAHLPGLSAPPESASLPPRMALEAYPGLLAVEILGRQSYKSDNKAQQTADRLVQRLALIDALEQGRTRLGLRLKLSPAQRDHLASDAQGDRLDAVLCLMQAAWGQQRLREGDARCGVPPGVDPVEGWILTA